MLISFLALPFLGNVQPVLAPTIPESYVYCNNYVAGSWTNPTYAYNNNTANGASIAWSPVGYCAYLTLNLSSAARGSKIRYWVGRSNTVITTMQIDIANATGSWRNVFSATPTYGAYANATITFSQYTALRFRFSKTGTASRTATVYETQAVNASFTAPNYLVDLNQWDSVFRIPYFTFPYGSLLVGSDGSGVELNLTLPSNPASSTFAINFEYANLSFYYQPPLNEELNVSEYTFVNATHAYNGSDLLNYRPENVVGSYAVYGIHQNNQYGTGKVFHIYRPLIIDNNGATLWGTLGLNLLNATNGILAIATNSTWMNSASYPVVIDPSFGYATIGKSSFNNYVSRDMRGTLFASTEVGTVSQVCAYFSPESAHNFVGGYYTDNAGAPNALVNQSAAVSAPTTAQWNNYTVSGAISVASYWLCVFPVSTSGGVNYAFYYDAGSTNQSARRYLAYGTSVMPNPFGTPDAYLDYKFSIFANYTAAGGATAYSFALSATVAKTVVLGWKTAYGYEQLATVTKAGTSILNLGYWFEESETKNLLKGANSYLSFGLNFLYIEPLAKTTILNIQDAIGFSELATLTKTSATLLTLGYGFQELGTVTKTSASTMLMALLFGFLETIVKTVSDWLNVGQCFAMVEGLTKTSESWFTITFPGQLFAYTFEFLETIGKVGDFCNYFAYHFPFSESVSKTGSLSFLDALAFALLGTVAKTSGSSLFNALSFSFLGTVAKTVSNVMTASFTGIVNLLFTLIATLAKTGQTTIQTGMGFQNLGTLAKTVSDIFNTAYTFLSTGTLAKTGASSISEGLLFTFTQTVSKVASSIATLEVGIVALVFEFLGTIGKTAIHYGVFPPILVPGVTNFALVLSMFAVVMMFVTLAITLDHRHKKVREPPE